MSRLYLKATSDARRTPITARGNQRIEAEILWGDKHTPKRAIKVVVNWRKGEETPDISVIRG